MQTLIIVTLKFVAYAAIVLVSLLGALAEGQNASVGGFILGGVAGFVIAVVASGILLLLIDIAEHLRIIAENTRRAA